MDALDHFLASGNERGSAFPEDLRLEALPEVTAIIRTGDAAVCARIAAAQHRRAAVVALALCASIAPEELRSGALKNLIAVCVDSESLFLFCTTCKGLRGWGRSLRAAIAEWYTAKSPDVLETLEDLPHSEWSHRDLLRLAHPKPIDEAQAQAFRRLLSRSATV